MCSRQKAPRLAPQNTPADYLPYNKEGPWWTSDSDGVQIKQSSEDGPSSFKSTPTMTLPVLFSRAADVNGQKPALRTSESNGKVKSARKWKTWTWREYFVEAQCFAKAALEFGLQQHDSVAIWGENSPEWAISTMGTILAGAKFVGLHPSESDELLLYQLQHCNARILVVQSQRMFDKAKLFVENLPNLELVLCWGCKADDIVRNVDGKVVKSLSFIVFLEIANKLPDTQIEERSKLIRPEHCCSIFYDLGSAKGAMFSHDNLHFATRCAFSIANSIGVSKNEFRFLSVTQFPSINAVVTDLFSPIAISANVNYKGWAVTHFSAAPLLNNLCAVRPQFVSMEPKLWDELSIILREKIEKSSGLWQKMVTFAQKKASARARAKILGSSDSPPATFMLPAQILGLVKKSIGLNKAMFLLAHGEGSFSPTTQFYFDSCGIRVNDSLGVTECCGLVAWSNPKFHQPPAVGFECPGVELRFGENDESEGTIKLRSRCVMMGYLANPALGNKHVQEIQEANREMIDKDGWLYTGLQCRRDESGMIFLKNTLQENNTQAI